MRAREIVKLRGQLNLSPAELAERCGVSRLTIIRWESGDTRPKGDHLRRLKSIADAGETGQVVILSENDWQTVLGAFGVALARVRSESPTLAERYEPVLAKIKEQVAAE